MVLCLFTTHDIQWVAEILYKKDHQFSQLHPSGFASRSRMALTPAKNVVPIEEPEDDGALTAVDDVDAEGEDLAVHRGAHLRQCVGLLGERGGQV